MAKKTLNGGNYGGTVLDVASGKTLVAVQSGDSEYWLYDLSVHPTTDTADFIGMASDVDPRVKDSATLIADFRGV